MTRSTYRETTNKKSNKKIVILSGIAVVLVLGTTVFLGIQTRDSLKEKKFDIQSLQDSLLIKSEKRNSTLDDVIRFSYSYLGQETETIQQLATSYDEYKLSNSNQDKLNANKKIDVSLNSILSVSKDYPLLSNDEFAKEVFNEVEQENKEQKELENNYNEEVEKYNNKLNSFPTNLYNNIFKYEPYPEYK